MNDQQKNEEIARKNLARQSAPQRSPKVGEPGYVYNDDGAEIQNPGPLRDPLQGDDKPVGWRQLGDRVIDKPDPDKVKQSDGKETNPGDKDGGAPLTPSEPGSTGKQVTDDSRAKPVAKK